MDQIAIAARMAGEWWATRLDLRHSNKKIAFAIAIAKRVDTELRLNPEISLYLECDYDPQGILLEAIREVIEPNCRGYRFSADGLLPQKHSLEVWCDRLSPIEGAGNILDDILVPG
jgi:hypothetical protein